MRPRVEQVNEGVEELVGHELVHEGVSVHVEVGLQREKDGFLGV